jgi:hypothetical protein
MLRPERGDAIHAPCRPAGKPQACEAAKARASAAPGFIRPSRSPAGADRNRNGLARQGGGVVMPEQFPSRHDEHHGQGCEQDREEKASHRHSPEVFFLKICFEPIAAPLRLLLRGRSDMPEERREDRFVPGVNQPHPARSRESGNRYSGTMPKKTWMPAFVAWAGRFERHHLRAFPLAS